MATTSSILARRSAGNALEAFEFILQEQRRRKEGAAQRGLQSRQLDLQQQNIGLRQQEIDIGRRQAGLEVRDGVLSEIESVKEIRQADNRLVLGDYLATMKDLKGPGINAVSQTIRNMIDGTGIISEKRLASVIGRANNAINKADLTDRERAEKQSELLESRLASSQQAVTLFAKFALDDPTPENLQAYRDVSSQYNALWHDTSTKIDELYGIKLEPAFAPEINIGDGGEVKIDPTTAPDLKGKQNAANMELLREFAASNSKGGFTLKQKDNLTGEDQIPIQEFIVGMKDRFSAINEKGRQVYDSHLPQGNFAIEDAKQNIDSQIQFAGQSRGVKEAFSTLGKLFEGDSTQVNQILNQLPPDEREKAQRAAVRALQGFGLGGDDNQFIGINLQDGTTAVVDSAGVSKPLFQDKQ